MPLKLDPMGPELESSCTLSSSNFSENLPLLIISRIVLCFGVSIFFIPFGTEFIAITMLQSLRSPFVDAEPLQHLHFVPPTSPWVQGWEGDAWLAPWGKDHVAELCLRSASSCGLPGLL